MRINGHGPWRHFALQERSRGVASLMCYLRYWGSSVGEIHKIGVLGAGTMGSQIAAQAANAGVPSVLLDQSSEAPSDRSRLARAGVEKALKARPAAFFVPEAARLITTGNFDDHLHLLGGCDWVIEAVTENLDVKRNLLSKVEQFISSTAILSSNTSGISIGAIAQRFPAGLRQRWLGTHFFNPPRYMKLLEIIPTPETLPEVVERVEQFGDVVLGKGIVRAKDRPNFIANRIGVFVHLAALEAMREEGLSIEQIDVLTGPAMGLPKSALFRTIDIVGLDVMAHVVENLYASLPDDPERESFRIPDFMVGMIERNLLGEKTGRGFYKRVPAKNGDGYEILTLDLTTFDYRPRQKPRFASVELAHGIADTRERVRTLFQATDAAGNFYRKLLGRTFHYAASRIPEIADDLVSVDRAMRWGFNWECGVFELWDAIGVERVVAAWREARTGVPPLAAGLLKGGHQTFYQLQNGRPEYFDLAHSSYAPVEGAPGLLLLAPLKAQGAEVKKNSGASLVDLGDGVICLEFHSKMNVIGPDSIQMIHAGLEALNAHFDAMVVGNQWANFSAGANLLLLLLSIQEGDWNEVDNAVRTFQSANMALKHAAKPVVAAPFGLTLGGGAEVMLHCARVTAAGESYIGLVETGVGLIPAGGGAKEMALRASDLAAAAGASDGFPYLKRAFETIGMAKVSTSASDARKLGYLSSADVVIMNRDRQIAAAKQVALDLVKLGYRAAAPRNDVSVPGAAAFNKLRLGLHLMRRAEYISEHDLLIGTKLARVLTGGGEFTSPQSVSEQYLLDLEREAFVSLCGERKTVERIQHMLKTGKPLRN